MRKARTDSLRKHRCQMETQEALFIERKVRSSEVGESLRHAQERATQKGINPQEVWRALRFGTLVEVHRNAWPDVRAVMRCNGVAVVVSLITQQVITAWRNSKDDQHETLRLSLYQWSVNLVNLLRRYDGQSKACEHCGSRTAIYKGSPVVLLYETKKASGEEKKP